MGPQGRSGRAENLVHTGVRSRTVQPVVAIPTELPGPHKFSVCHKYEIPNPDSGTVGAFIFLFFFIDTVTLVWVSDSGVI